MTFSSHFSSVLNTNYTPTSQDVADLRHLLVEPHKKLSTLEAEISRLQTALKALISERDEVQSFIHAHKALISPLRCFPAETLAEIFFHCLPADRIPTIDPSEAPLLLTRITRNWRDIALGTPRLWCAIHIYAPLKHNEQQTQARLQRQKEQMETWLSRSGSLPLSISLNMEDAMYRPMHLRLDPASHLFLVDYIKSLSLRWERIELKVGEAGIRLLDTLTPEDVPRLKTFVLDSNDPSQAVGAVGVLTDDKSTFLPSFAQASALQKLGLIGYRKQARGFLTPAIWSDLTELTFRSDPSQESLTINQALNVLARLSKLQLCNLSISLDGLPTLSSPRDTLLIHLPFLRDFALNFHTWSLPPFQLDYDRCVSMITNFFTILSLKSLHSLAVCVPYTSRPDDTWTEVPFLSLPLDHLEYLTLRVPVTSEALTKCLISVPKLTSLRVFDYSRARPWNDSEIEPLALQDQHLSLLTPSAASLPLCPLLREIIFTNCNVSDKAICDLAQARWSFDREQHPEMRQLESLRATVLNRGMKEDTRIILSKLKEEGMDIRLRYSAVVPPGPYPSDKGYILPNRYPFDDTAEFRPVLPYAVDVP